MLGEQFANSVDVLELGLWHGRYPDSLVKFFLNKVINCAEIVDISDIACFIKLFRKVYFVILGKEVLLNEKLSELLFLIAGRENKLFEEISEPVIVDEVGSDTQLAYFRVWVCHDAIANST